MSLTEGDYFWTQIFQRDTNSELEYYSASLLGKSTSPFLFPFIDSARLAGKLDKERADREKVVEGLPEHAKLQHGPPLSSSSALKRLVLQGGDSGVLEQPLFQEIIGSLGKLGFIGRASLTEGQRSLVIREDIKDSERWLDRTFQITEVPLDELRYRLNRGEIMPKAEYVPTISKGKQSLTLEAVEEKLKFGDKLMEEGKQKFKEGDYDGASILFVQGVHLLEFSTSDEVAVAFDIRDMYNKFLRNLAISCLRRNSLQEGIKACRTAVDEDPTDMRCQFLLAKFLHRLGDTQAAKDVLNSQIIHNAYAEIGHKNAAKELLHEILNSEAKSNREAARTITAITASVNKDTEVGYPSATTGNNNSMAGDELTSSSEASTTASPATATEEGIAGFAGQVEKVTMEMLGLEECRSALTALLDAYTSDSVRLDLQKIRFASDYDERRILIRLRKFLPNVVGPILAPYVEKLGAHHADDDGTRAVKVLERSAVHYSRMDQPLRDLYGEVRAALMTESPC